jgi:hypothetical protein
MATPKEKSLQSQVKLAWRRYYDILDCMQGLAEANQVILSHIADFSKANENNTELPRHIVLELLDNAQALQKALECPVCYSTLTKETIYYAGCGHKLCRGCLDILKANANMKCPTCRAKIYYK